MQENLLQLGAVAILFLVGIREFFSYLKSKKENGGNGSYLNASILRELQTMNNNHLHTIQETLEQGNARLIDTIHNDNTKIVELLGEIKGNLSQRR